MAVDSTQIAQVVSQGFFWVLILGAILGLVVIGIWLAVFMFKYLKYKVLIYIAEPIGDPGITNRQILWKKDIGKEVLSKDGKAELKLFQTRESMTIPSPGMYSTGGIFGSRKVLFLRRYQGLLGPMAVQENSATTFNFNLDALGVAMAWREKSRQMGLEAYKGQEAFFEKYGNILLLGTFTIIHFVLMFILITQIQDGVTVKAVIDTSQLVVQG